MKYIFIDIIPPFHFTALGRGVLFHRSCPIRCRKQLQFCEPNQLALFSLLTLFHCFLKHNKRLSSAAGSQHHSCLAQQTLRRKGSSTATSLPSLISPNYQRVSKQYDMTDLLSESCGHDCEALSAYYDRSVMVIEGKSVPWRQHLRSAQPIILHCVVVVMVRQRASYLLW